MYPFFKSKVFFKQIAISISVVVLLITIVLFGLKLYTRHNVFYEVPELFGIELTQAEDIAKTENLHIKVVDSIFVKNTTAGTILEQYPKAGVKVKKHRNVSVTICSAKPESIPFPNLKNIAYRQTLNTLLNLGFNIGEIKYKEYKHKNLVLGLRFKNDSIAPGTMIEKGSYIDLIVGKGNNNTVLIPLLLKKTVKEANNILHYSYLNVGRIYYDKTVKTEKDKRFAKIWKQSPIYDKDKNLDVGQKITLWATLDSTRLTVADSTISKIRNLSNIKKW